MRARDYFPLGIASGLGFCNRKEEMSVLINNIQNGKHTLLIATRRYGKSSLALQAIKLTSLPYIEIDFYMANNENTIESYILNGVIELIGKTFGSIEKIVSSIKKYVKHLKPKLDIGMKYFKLELAADVESDPATNVKEALLLLEKLLKEKKKYAVLFMDEFQNVGIIAQGKGIDAAIRHVAQKTKHLTILFSGSNRKLLKTMFEDENRPLYKLCWKLPVKRIAAEHYQAHLRKAALSAWKKELDYSAVTQIISLSERHPYYLNKLCDRLWTYFEKTPPSSNEIENIWLQVLEEEKSDAVKEISQLSIGQKNVLLQIAKKIPQLTSKQSILEINMSSSSITTALEGLEEKDVIEKEEGHYQIINPVVKFYVLQASKIKSN